MSPEEMVKQTDSLDRRFEAERALTEASVKVFAERLAGMDRATALLDETVNRVPTEVTKEVTHLRELTEEHFASIALQFKERDSRAERESRDSKIALDAALAAQKEAAAEQNKSNMLAIDKSEKATAETLTKLTDMFESRNRSLSEKVDDLKERINGAESHSRGATDTRTESRQNVNVWIGVGGFVLALLAFVVMAWSLSRTPAVSVTPDQTPAVTVTVPSGG
jgi:cation transport regulator ChaB